MRSWRHHPQGGCPTVQNRDVDLILFCCFLWLDSAGLVEVGSSARAVRAVMGMDPLESIHSLEFFLISEHTATF